QPAHTLGVDEDLSDPEAREERGGHSPTVLVEELDEVEVRADGHDQRRRLLVGDQHGDVLAGARRGHELVGQAERLQVLAARRATTRHGRSRKSVANWGRSSLPDSSSRSATMCSTVLCAKASSASPISLRRWSFSAWTVAGSWTSPRATTSPLRRISPPLITI